MEYKPEILQLTALRQSKGISLETIADQTKISAYYLRAIEDLDLAKLPGGVYRDNFLRQYARAIDDDLAEELCRKLLKAAREAAEAQASAKANSGVMRVVKETLTRGAALVFLFSHADSLPGELSTLEQNVRKEDPRYRALFNFFQKHKCPIQHLAKDFISAADRNGLDWRLLPSIVFLESSGGKYLTGKNLMGWGSGKSTFQNERQGIHHVAERLSKSPLYAGKDTTAKLKIYNPARKDYPVRVFEIMEQLGSGLMAAQ
ncbi:MAG TPA: helix-turn-helix transcriptional regulator [Bryobacteraceae bacterium]|nr:helix-turn-helix transcriptional regulator [Bryobacteraceae bacterium]